MNVGIVGWARPFISKFTNAQYMVYLFCALLLMYLIEYSTQVARWSRSSLESRAQRRGCKFERKFCVGTLNRGSNGHKNVMNRLEARFVIPCRPYFLCIGTFSCRFGTTFSTSFPLTASLMLSNPERGNTTSLPIRIVLTVFLALVLLGALAGNVFCFYCCQLFLRGTQFIVLSDGDKVRFPLIRETRLQATQSRRKSLLFLVTVSSMLQSTGC